MRYLPSSKQLLLLVATFWVGSLWTVGYVVAPTLFSSIADRSVAGAIAGAIFKVEAWLSIVCALLVAILILAAHRASNQLSVQANDRANDRIDSRQRNTLLRIVIAMATCTVIGYFGLQPIMAALRQAGGVAIDARMVFGLVHAGAALIFLIQSVLGLALMLKLQG